ncbi:MAG: DinB family protein [Bacteroidia bacterium]
MTNKEFFINSWQRDAVVTAKAFRSLPDDMSKLNFTHHKNFRSPWEIVNHVGPHAKELSQAIAEGRLDLTNEGKFDLAGPNIYKSCEDAAKDVEANSTKLADLAAKCDEDTWMNKIIPVYWGPNKIFEMPLFQLCWAMLFDTVHHRGQLTSYYRIVGATQPELMGPTYEVEEAMFAKANSN